MASGCQTTEDLVSYAQHLLDVIDQHMSDVGNVLKLRKKIEAELNFLKKFMADHPAGTELRCTNLTQLGGVVDYIRGSEGTVETMRVFRTPMSCERAVSVVVDVVSAAGLEWRKIVARNPAWLLREWRGQAEFTQRPTLIAQAKNYLKVAHHHPLHYHTPKIHFHFLFGVKRKMAERLNSLGVQVQGDVLELDDDDNEFSDDCDDTDSDDSDLSDDGPSCDVEEISAESCETNLVNLDITACIALISALTHGRCHFQFVEPILTEQAERERCSPVLPGLEEFLKDKELIICRTAHGELMQIVETIGGDDERRRLVELMSRVRVVDDVISNRARGLIVQGRVTRRGRVIFGTGDALRAVTVTANSGFVRAARGQGVEFTVFIHEARALTEMKEPAAVTIPSKTENSSVVSLSS